MILDEALKDNNIADEEDLSFVIDDTNDQKAGQQENIMLTTMAQNENPTNS